MELVKNSPKDCYVTVQKTTLVILERLQRVLEMEVSSLLLHLKNNRNNLVWKYKCPQEVFPIHPVVVFIMVVSKIKSINRRCTMCNKSKLRLGAVRCIVNIYNLEKFYSNDVTDCKVKKLKMGAVLISVYIFCRTTLRVLQIE